MTASSSERPWANCQLEGEGGGVQGVIGFYRELIGFGDRVGDMINGLVTFNYGLLSDIQDDGSFASNVAILFTLGVTMGLVYFLFDSNLQTSKLGWMLLLGVSITGGLASSWGSLLQAEDDAVARVTVVLELCLKGKKGELREK